MKINKKLELGMKAVQLLHKATKPMTCKQLAEESGTTVQFMEQIMGNLRKAKLTTTVRGPGGGNILVKRIDVSALDIAMATSKEFKDTQDYYSSTVPLEPQQRLHFAIVEAYRNTYV